MQRPDPHGAEQIRLTRRHFNQLGGAAAAAWSAFPLAAADAGVDPLLREAIAKLEYLTPLDRAFLLDKGKANVAKLRRRGCARSDSFRRPGLWIWSRTRRATAAWSNPSHGCWETLWTGRVL
jgi:hypothetical protein